MPEAIVCVFAKPPVAGKVKTRLIPAVGPERAAELAEAFLQDTLDSLGMPKWAEVIIAATGPFHRPYLHTYRVWIQPEGTLDHRIEAILRCALREAPLAIAIGADSPGLPGNTLEEARRLLNSQDAVLGPTTDGGFYLLGVKDCPEGFLAGIEWSRPTTMRDTIHRLRSRGLSLSLMSEWFDIDTPHDLSRLEDLLAQGLVTCTHTRVILENIRNSTLDLKNR